MKKQILALSVIFGLNAVAQNRQCATMENFELLKSQYPEMIKQMNIIEDQTQQFVISESTAKTNGTNSVMVVRNIPVVVHVLYNTTAQNISDAQIQSQITILNNDFRRLNADRTNTPSTFTSVAADAEINFCLASVSPTGTTTTGINRVYTSTTSFGSDDKMKSSSTGGVNAWPTDKYLNIWVCNLGGGLLGYAQFPGGPTSTDGVVIGYKYFGNTGTATAPFNKGRTATHEVGHWLNLRHIWGDASCGSDLVSDTPTHQAENYSCPSHPKSNSCGTSAEMFMNYMDYTDDGCMNMFSTGQKTRMQALFASGGARASLLTSNGCGSGTSTTTCGVPSSLSASSISTTGATLGWASVSGATSYSIQYKASSATTWATTTSTTNSKSITGLSANTTYQFKVMSVCSSGSSAYSATSSFTTSSSSTTTGVNVTVGSGTGNTSTAPYGTYYMDERMQFILTKAELAAAGYTSANNIIRSLAFNVYSVSTQTMNGFTIKLRHTTAASFASSSFLSSTGMTTVYSGNVAVSATGWKTHTFTTPFNYNGTDNLLIEICWDNSSYTTDSKVYATSTTSYNALYKKSDVSAGGICSTTTGTLTYTRPNMRLYFSGSSTAFSARTDGEEVVLDDALEIQSNNLKLYPNPTNELLNIEFDNADDNSITTIGIYNMMGELISNYVPEAKETGRRTLSINLNENPDLQKLNNGVYLCVLSVNGKITTARFSIQR